jgi:ComF family protein
VASIRAAFRFDGPVRDALLRLKFAGERALAEPIGRAMAAAVEPGAPAGQGRPVTWVPLSSRRRAARGYDQAEALARAAAAAAGAPVIRVLDRVVDASPQAKRSRAQRLGALWGAFVTTGAAPEEVILVDDVVTTGSTAAECARVLRAAGARRVHVLAAARTLSGPDG